MKQQLVGMFREALGSLDLARRMAARIHCERSLLTIHDDLYDLDAFTQLRVIAIGKAAAEMATTFDLLIGRGRASGIVVAPYEATAMLPNFRYLTGGHPYPTKGSFTAARAVLQMLETCDEQSLVIFLISGGGSAVFELPLFDDIEIEDCRRFYELLVTCGANIYEMNVLRKHFSAVKGGRLAVAAWPARQATLFVSDVPAGKDSTVASGPTMPDESTVKECQQVLARYDLALPTSYRREIPETPKPGEGNFDHSRYYKLLSNEDGVKALADLARARGWNTVIDVSCDDWPLERATSYLLDRLVGMQRPACVVSGGELSSPVTGTGTGGRNLAFVLDCAMHIGNERIAVLSAGTDGVDGNSPAAGAVADGTTMERAAKAGLDPRDYFARSDSHTFFGLLGDAIVTGPTGNNVRDLRILLAY
jgi:hydroxypyruvate reductase